MGDSDSQAEDQLGCHDSSKCCHCGGCLGMSDLFVRGFPHGSKLRISSLKAFMDTKLKDKLLGEVSSAFLSNVVYNYTSPKRAKNFAFLHGPQDCGRRRSQFANPQKLALLLLWRACAPAVESPSFKIWVFNLKTPGVGGQDYPTFGPNPNAVEPWLAPVQPLLSVWVLLFGFGTRHLSQTLVCPGVTDELKAKQSADRTLSSATYLLPPLGQVT
ncbi:hypothetical protein llap_4715 [Limosa lapponica baueri]|uniref:Uncharacterized protein n=1 Tax=Limosa lapponica baueri TaxID=1758121 RepID=A0A2I0UG17_LIMLA|nr:hypothetical protein llap_4715 [Limosa lapponica baueri]